MSVEGAYEFVLENAGATLPKRDAVDERIVKEVRSGKANSNEGIITDISQVGGYLEYKGEPYHDKGKDGIPDKWEKKFGLDPNDPSDANKDLNGECILTLKSISMGLILKTK